TNTRHTLNFRGGAERMRYFVSGAYFGESGLYIINKDYNNNAGLRRYNLRSNVDIDVTKSTKLSVDLSGQYLMTNYPSEQTSTLIQWFSQSPPYIIPHIYSDGTLAQKFGEFVNPYNRLMETGYRKEWRAGIQSKIQLEQKLDFVMRGLKARGIMSYDANSQYNMEREKSPETFYAEGRDPNGDLIFSTTANGSPFGAPSTTNSGDKNIYIETALNYDRTFAKHTVGGMALYYQKDRQLSNNALAYRKQAWIGRATYGFDNRYHIEGNFSVTGSEQFADGYRFGFFPAVGVAWNVTNEPFFPDNLKNAISNLKLRASIGRTGNDNTGGSRFMYRPTFDSSDGYSIGIGSSAPINNVGSGLIEGRFEAPYLSWEIELKRNYGIDLSVWRDMFTLQLDYFDNLRDNILMQRKTVSGTAGFRQTPWQNFGIVSNKGVDASLNMYKKVGEVGVALRGNFTYARNKILEYDEIPQPYPWMQVTGTRLLALRGMVAERLFREDDFHISIGPDGQKVYTLREGLAPYTGHGNPQPGDIKYVDQNGDGVVDTYADIVQDYMHPTVPEIMYGFGVNLDYSGFYFNIFFQGAGNVSLNLNNSQAQFSPFYEGIVRGSIRQEFIDSRWTEDNPSQNVFAPRITLQGRGNSYSQVNTWWYRDASFLRLKNIEVGYNFKPAFLDRLKIRSTRVYAMGQNVAVWDKIKMFDPEMGSSGAGTRYPLPSIWTVGLDFTF
ncbi:MAG TPA: SusC/RagA family TonB-linked outer membrane protein, partial [Sphingobacterium sp.]|nr:SusC/RagA family TonB-linked outer membrane protein [Sphingobacterium sp.]